MIYEFRFDRDNKMIEWLEEHVLDWRTLCKHIPENGVALWSLDLNEEDEILFRLKFKL